MSDPGFNRGDQSPPETRPGEVTLLLREIEAGDALAAERILPLVYQELRRLAAAKLAREPAVRTLQPTALVHEAWLRLGGDHQADWRNRAHFFAAAAEAMRRILIDLARRRQAVRHGHGLEKVSLDAAGFDLAEPGEDDAQLLLVHEALERFAAVDPRKAELVKLRYFGGLAQDEAAAALGISAATAKRDWAYARAWLFQEVRRLQG